VTQAEFCHFTAGECTFTPENGAPIEIRAGDALFFPPNSLGVWDIRTTARKVFIVFGYTFDTLPHLGVRDGVHYCMGYCGSGVSLSTHFGRKIGLQILGRPEGRTALDDLPFATRPLYYGTRWFLTPSVLAYRMLDA
jgi:hypothetical protein